MDEFDKFEWELKQALERRAAPVTLKGRIMAKRGARLTARREMGRRLAWQAMAAAALLAVVAGGTSEWRAHMLEERRQGEAAKAQVMTALRITNHALDEMNRQLAEHNKTQDKAQE